MKVHLLVSELYTYVIVLIACCFGPSFTSYLTFVTKSGLGLSECIFR